MTLRRRQRWQFFSCSATWQSDTELEDELSLFLATTVRAWMEILCWRRSHRSKSKTIGRMLVERFVDKPRWEYQTDKVSCLLTSLRVHFLVFSYFLPSYSRLVFSYPNIHNFFHVFSLLSFARELLPVLSLSKTVKREFIGTLFLPIRFCTEVFETQ